MNFKELVEIVAQETGRPASQVRKVSLAVLEKFAGLIENETDFVSPVITIKSVTVSAQPASEDKPAKPERKFARMSIRTKKTNKDETKTEDN